MEVRQGHPFENSIGVCLICNTAECNDVVVTSRWIDYLGVVCICLSCCAELGRFAGLSNERALQVKLKETKDELEKVGKKLIGFQALAKSLAGATNA